MGEFYKEPTRTCYTNACNAPAAFVIKRRGSEYGYYCKKHVEKRLKELNAQVENDRKG